MTFSKIIKIALFSDDSSDEEQDLLTVKRKDHTIEENEVDPLEDQILETDPKVGRIITKASIAKKILKKNIQANQKISFDEAGEMKADGISQKKSKEGQNYDLDDEEISGIDLEKVKKVLKAEDKFDRELVKERKKAKKRELKEAKNANNKRNATKVSFYFLSFAFQVR